MVKPYTKVPVGAHYGLAEWLLQRLTGVIMAAYTLGVLAVLVFHAPASYAEWKGLFAGTFARLATMLFFAALLYHAWVGMRDILMDYVKPTGIRLMLQFAVAVALLYYLIWAASVLWAR